jgi:hypothetical protein
MADTAAVWRASPALYFAALNELVNGAEAEHGPWPLEDFDAKLVRAEVARSCARRSLSVCCDAGSYPTQSAPPSCPCLAHLRRMQASLPESPALLGVSAAHSRSEEVRARLMW